MAFSATSTVSVRSAVSSAALHLASKPGQAYPATAKPATSPAMSAATAATNAGRIAYLSRLQAALSPARALLLRFDLTALGAAIHSGNLPSARTAYITFKGDLRDIPQQQLNYTNSGLPQTATRADVRIDLLNSITQAAQDAALQLRQSTSADTGANVGPIIDTYV